VSNTRTIKLVFNGWWGRAGGTFIGRPASAWSVCEPFAGHPANSTLSSVTLLDLGVDVSDARQFGISESQYEVGKFYRFGVSDAAS
jgi:hypothetical protein